MVINRVLDKQYRFIGIHNYRKLIMNETIIEKRIMDMIYIRMNELNSIEKMTIDNVNECQLIDDLIDTIKMICDNRDKIIERMKKS